jgi:CDP-diacylglycerol pyrophosphatase
VSTTKKALLGIAVLMAALGGVAAADRTALWMVVQACIADHKLTGLAFPCLEVNEFSGTENGFVVVRAPLAKTHIIVSPTARVVGIEDPSLQRSSVTNFARNAWEARHYVIEAAVRPVRDSDIGLAVNSRPGRSQDQLHIHVDCLQAKYADEVRKHDSSISQQEWLRLQFPLRGRYYWAIRLNDPDVAHTNVFALASSLLRTSPGRLENVTLVLIPRPAEIRGGGFYLLADQYTPGASGKAHGEFLLDHSCAAK